MSKNKSEYNLMFGVLDKKTHENIFFRKNMSVDDFEKEWRDVKLKIFGGRDAKRRRS